MSQNYAALRKKQLNAFTRRHVGLSEADIDKMLKVCGCGSLEDLIKKTVPEGIRSEAPLSLPDAAPEFRLADEMRSIARANLYAKDMIGQGYYATQIPAVIQRNILENPGWYTAYTPYQAEISQGRLEALLNFQTMVRDLTGLEIANASLLDEATAAAEAMTLSRRQSKSESQKFFVSNLCHPQTIDVLKARAEPLNYEIIIDIPQKATEYDVFGAMMQYPATDGTVSDFSLIVRKLKEKNVIVSFATDLLALTLLKSPGEMEADIAFGSSQRFGVPFGFGGPHAAFFACKAEFKRNIPGRLVGVSVDCNGKQAYRLALQTREQHIRREKATSNICTAQVLLAIMASMYACYHGPKGLRDIAERTHLLTCIFTQGLKENTDFTFVGESFFDTIVINTNDKTHIIHDNALREQYNLRHFSETQVGISFDEDSDEKTVRDLWRIFGVDADFHAIASQIGISEEIPLRTSSYLTHPVFNAYHSETELMRYMRKLMDKDLALDRAMIPLGSCTMKLNAATEMVPVTLPGFANIHPFRPLDQLRGYLRLIERLENSLAEITGFDAVSLQPNSGAAGEYAGLMAIRGYHMQNGHPNRVVCLIPSSAHGTNPASAMMAGMKIIVVKCDADGNIDIEDLRTKAIENAGRLAALMMTYPSTHGVFEQDIREICQIIHENGGQVYMDGANMNAQVGVTSPALIGADVCHLNLHKTFCIPHGGGGPGVGPIGVKAHLKPFLPGHAALDNAPKRHRRDYYPISAAPFGSAGILAISYAYLRMMGPEGLAYATQAAILSANYVAKRLEEHYPVLYRGVNGTVAHECILDTRPLKEDYGVSVDDIAKRLADYGFHAPTMSFPVVGTLMIEPTESESLQELDRFCEAMIAIKKEILNIKKGVYSYEDSPLAGAPHTAEMLTTPHWDRPYSRKTAVFPLENMEMTKYWPSVGRIDNAHGDRNLICSCPDISTYAEEEDAAA
ncbi:MAG: aminomethyl-transferring glycine dehydrogenase [Pseudomonadota bacterium]